MDKIDGSTFLLARSVIAYRVSTYHFTLMLIYIFIFVYKLFSSFIVR